MALGAGAGCRSLHESWSTPTRRGGNCQNSAARIGSSWQLDAGAAMTETCHVPLDKRGTARTCYLVADTFGIANCETVAPPALGDTQQGNAAARGGTVAARSSQAFRRQSAKAAAAWAKTKDHSKAATAATRRRQPRDAAVLNPRARLNPLSLAARHGQRSYPGDQPVAIERRIATATPPNRLTTQRRLLQRAAGNAWVQ